MRDIDRKLHTGPITTTECRNLFDKNARNRGQTAIRLLDSSLNFPFQRRVVCRLNAFESPEGSVQTGDCLFREAKLDQPCNVLLRGQIPGLGLEKEFEIPLPRWRQ